MKKIAKVLCLLLCFAMLGSFAVMAAEPASGGTVEGSVLELPWMTDLTQYVPYADTGSMEKKFQRNIFDGLINYDPSNGNAMIPGLAETWEKSDDGLKFLVGGTPRAVRDEIVHRRHVDLGRLGFREVELLLRLPLPCCGLLRCHAERFVVDLALQLQAHAYDVCPVRCDC